MSAAANYDRLQAAFAVEPTEREQRALRWLADCERETVETIAALAERSRSMASATNHAAARRAIEADAKQAVAYYLEDRRVSATCPSGEQWRKEAFAGCFEDAEYGVSRELAERWFNGAWELELGRRTNAPVGEAGVETLAQRIADRSFDVLRFSNRIKAALAAVEERQDPRWHELRLAADKAAQASDGSDVKACLRWLRCAADLEAELTGDDDAFADLIEELDSNAVREP